MMKFEIWNQKWFLNKQIRLDKKMKSILLTIMVTLSLATFFSACEKTDYQHPGYRNSH